GIVCELTAVYLLRTALLPGVSHNAVSPAHSDVWMQMLADVSGLRIELPQVEETGCFGAALAARVGTRVYRDFSEAQRDLQHPVRTLLPDMAAHQLYQQKYQRYQHL
ncbi:FGGY-family carbohydrate kinase, partial [Pseudomonas aeruginosa]|uniref:FGGY-family carbohydrate kinase n=1 Tax=Pseudomonas aeruginosa TaxID=287 RepID=UPI0031B763AA